MRTRAVLFDRDGTLVENVPYNADRGLVRCKATARQALRDCRSSGLLVGVVTNQSGIGRGWFSSDAAWEVAAEIECQLGKFDVWRMCEHAPWDSCNCRKPKPGLIVSAAKALGIRPDECVVIGDSLVDIEAARAGGARSILVPDSGKSTQGMMQDSPIAQNLVQAVSLILDWEAAPVH